LKRISALPLKTPEVLTKWAWTDFNETLSNSYQDNLKELCVKYHCMLEKIYNMDESSLSTVLNKLRKIIGEKGRKVSEIKGGLHQRWLT
jgi:hypothetical protein